MTILAQDLINAIAAELSDTDFVTWSADELLEYLNSGILRVCLLRPDACSSVESIQLVAGTKQTLPATSRRLLDITRNMGVDGATPGKVITTISTRDMDLYNPTWHQDTAVTSINHYMYDEETPDTFFVTPPVHATTQVHIEMKLANNPAVITDQAAENIPINDVYRPALEHWLLYKAYDKETDSDHSVAEAKFHFQAFNFLFGQKAQIDKGYSPSREVKEDK